MKRAVLAAVLVLAGCPHHRDEPRKDAAVVAPIAKPDAALADDGLPPSPPLPAVPAGLPPLPDTSALSAVTPDAVAFGALLFSDPRLSASGKTSCATCHDPAHGYSGGIDNAADGKPNLRRTPALVNLAWATAYGWDGRYATLEQQLAAHIHGELGADMPDDPRYRAYARRAGRPDAMVAGLAAFVLTRYSGDAPWDRREASARAPKPGSAAADDVTAGYLLFTGKAQCGVCHLPPLYTDGGYHRIGKVGAPDEGRGRVDPVLAGAFKTPTLRGAATRPSLFHTGDAHSLDDAIHWYEQVGGDTTRHDPAKLDPALFHVALTPAEHAQLLAFLRALTPS